MSAANKVIRMDPMDLRTLSNQPEYNRRMLDRISSHGAFRINNRADVLSINTHVPPAFFENASVHLVIVRPDGRVYRARIYEATLMAPGHVELRVASFQRLRQTGSAARMTELGVYVQTSTGFKKIRPILRWMKHTRPQALPS
jgi:hypothetical protein